MGVDLTFKMLQFSRGCTWISSKQCLKNVLTYAHNLACTPPTFTRVTAHMHALPTCGPSPFCCNTFQLVLLWPGLDAPSLTHVRATVASASPASPRQVHVDASLIIELIACVLGRRACLVCLPSKLHGPSIPRFPEDVLYLCS